jgi:hypothetical protein
MNSKGIGETCFIVLVVVFCSVLCVYAPEAEAASHTMKAPQTFSSVSLPPADYYGYDPLYGFSLNLEGWACSAKFAETTIHRIREMNRLIQPLAAIQVSFVQLEKVLSEANRDPSAALSKQQVEDVVYRTVSDYTKRAGLTGENDLLQRAESLWNDILEGAKAGYASFFEYWGQQDLFRSEYYGTPSGIWRISKMEPDTPPSAVFIAEDCYQKNDLDTMMNSVLSAGQKLKEAVARYQDAKKRILESAGRK